MDPTQFAPGAGAPPSAAEPTLLDPNTGLGASEVGGTPIPEAVTPVAGATQPIAGMGAPDAAATPPSTPSTATQPAAPQFAPEQVAQWQQDAQRFAQVRQELQQLAQAQERQRQEAEAERLSQQRIDAIYATARNMEPEAGIEYIRQQEGVERARLRGEVQQIQQQSQQQLYQALQQASAPLYAQHLAKTNGLPAEYAERLAMLPPQQMDAYLPVLLQEYRNAQAIQTQLQQALAQIDQLRRSQQAGTMAAQGVQTGAGAGVSPVPGNPNGNVQPGSPDHLLSLPGVAALFGMRPAGG